MIYHIILTTIEFAYLSFPPQKYIRYVDKQQYNLLNALYIYSS